MPKRSRFYRPFRIVGYVDVYGDRLLMSLMKQAIGPKYLPDIVLANCYRTNVYDVLRGIESRDWGMLDFVSLGAN